MISKNIPLATGLSYWANIMIESTCWQGFLHQSSEKMTKCIRLEGIVSLCPTGLQLLEILYSLLVSKTLLGWKEEQSAQTRMQKGNC